MINVPPRSKLSLDCKTLLCLLVLGLILHALPARGQETFPGGGLSPFGSDAAAEESQVSVEAVVERSTVSPGKDLRVAVVLTVARDWHIYHEELGPPDAVGAPTQVTLEAEGVTFGKVRFPEPEKLPQPGLAADGGDTWIYSHHGKVVFYALGQVAEGASEGERELKVQVSGLACKTACLPFDVATQVKLTVGKESSDPTDQNIFRGFPADLTAVPPTAAPPNGPTAEPPDEGEDFGNVTFPGYEVQHTEESHSFLLYIVFGLIAGFLLNFMPCVLPVISIKILSFVQQAGEDPRRIFRLGLTFSAGILVVFVALAALAAFFGQGWGEQFQSQEFLIVMISIVFAFSLSLFGVFEIGVPQSVTGLGAQGVREGYGDAFFKGVMATVLATPCSGPFLGSTLTWALAQSPVVIFTIFTAIGVGMALPYTLLTAKPAWLSLLPKPGAWMETFKHSMGFVLLLTVIYLMVSLQQSLLLFTVTFLLFVTIAAWAYGRYATYSRGRGFRLAMLGVSLGIAGLGAYLSFDTFQGLFTTQGALQWEAFHPTRLSSLHEEGRSVMVDWTADWCPNCKAVEKFVLESDAIVPLLRRKGVVPMKADITHDTSKTRVMKQLQRQLGSHSIPFLAIFPGDTPLEPHVLRDIYTRDDLRAILETLPDYDVGEDGVGEDGAGEAAGEEGVSGTTLDKE